MKLSWDNIDGLVYVKSLEKWRTKKWKYYVLAECTFCGDEYFARSEKFQKNKFGYCSHECQLQCPKQRNKQGRSLSVAWKEPEKRKTLIKGLAKGIIASGKTIREKISKIDTNQIVCSKCGEAKHINEYTKDSRLIMGIAAACRDCKRGQYKSWLNKDGSRQKRYLYIRSLIKSNPKFKLRTRISAAISLSIKGNKHGRPWESLVGYTLNDLRVHLERKFQSGMTWTNYGKWHIDHKTPLKVFNFTKPEHEDFKRCWALDNLQPLWASENCAKGAKLKKHFQPRLQMEAV
ncbi:hypothetical protein LCGC14_1736380 [marine sediment metagenome]|uniref:Uncharacterized protein n=1 Tax=marine sediment metagenome TaxID=412755 RepID=A0A0F9H7Z9_9ZZZZ